MTASGAKLPLTWLLPMRVLPVALGIALTVLKFLA
jgi:hypothetical protein